MKKLLLFITMLLILIGCNSSSTSPTPTTTTKGVTVSDCQAKKAHRTNSLGDALDNNHTYVSYKYENSKLWLTHHNVAFNCDKRGIGATSKVEENSITITERQNLPKDGGMNCECIFDVSITLSDIEAKNYTLNYDDGRSTDIHFDINLGSKLQGIKSFERNSYPYGQEPIDTSITPLTRELVLAPLNHTSVLANKTSIVDTEDSFDQAMLELKNVGDTKIDEWVETIENTSIDWNKEMLLLYTFEESCLYDYRSLVEATNRGAVTIKLHKVREECADISSQYLLAYTISKEVKQLSLDHHAPILLRGTAKTVEADNPNEIFFPRQNSKPLINLESRTSGILTNTNGCLRINGELIIFPNNASLKDKDGETVIYNMEDEAIAKVGENVVFGGFTLRNIEGEDNADEKAKNLSAQFPTSRCSEPYFVVHSVL